MGFNCGIVGLPNVGKSTLFNALTATSAADAQNYPFCTIDPNEGKVAVPDPRLFTLARIASSREIVPTQLGIVDIAGLVKDAHKGEGLGNQFLSHIRNTDAIIHMVRCFENADITHVEGGVDPLRDIQVIENELLLSDLISLEKRQQALGKKAKTDKAAAAELQLLEEILKHLYAGKFDFFDNQVKKEIASWQLLSLKPMLYVCNVSDQEVVSGNIWTNQVQQYASSKGASALLISAAVEAEVAQMSDLQEQKEYLNALGLSETGLSQVIRAGYGLLDLMTFFTIGPKEAHAWTIGSKTLAPQAAGVIHSDFERGFIRVEVISYDDYIHYQGESAAKAAGKLRVEGKDYVVQDGDVLHFRFNV